MRATRRFLGESPFASPPGTSFELGGIQAVLVGGQWQLRGEESLDPARLREFNDGPLTALRQFAAGRLCIHGSCFAKAARAVCIMGPSGMGKSTLLAASCARGVEFVSDGMTVVTPGSGEVEPGLSRFKLDEQARALVGVRGTTFDAVGPHSRKSYVPGPDSVTSARLGFLVELKRGEPSFRKVVGASALTSLLGNLYLGPRVPQPCQAGLLQQCAAVLSAAELWTLSSPLGAEGLEWSLQAILSLVAEPSGAPLP